MSALAAGLRADLSAALPGLTAPWRRAFAAVPREDFVPRFFLHRPAGGLRAVDSGDPDWLLSVYADLELITQLDGTEERWQEAHRNGPVTGLPTSSSTQPSLTGLMLETLEPRPGDRVLEVGTGTGYNAALLCHRLGGEQVSTIELDESIAEPARRRLADAGYTPSVAVADAALGHPAEAPYDRILSTCSWPRVPLPWLEQIRPGGLICTQLHTDLDVGALVLLRAEPDGSANGRFLVQRVCCTPCRGLPPLDPLLLLRKALRDKAKVSRGPAALPVATILSGDFSLFAALRVPGVAVRRFQPPGAPAMQTWLLGRDGSWAHEELVGGRRCVVQCGRRRLWNEIEVVHREWTGLGAPPRQRFGLTVSAAGHCLWLDRPDGKHRWPLPG